uniref:Cleavage stimulation factor 50 kDa subunit n=1 Tax=Ditylenchus dipsaci TaxID=166011 RepID=A0A915EGF2_9BILA
MKPDLKDRDYTYKLIIGQLFYDGHQQLALNLSQALGLSLHPPPPSDKLFRLVAIAKQFVDDPEAKEKESIIQHDYEGTGLDLENDAVYLTAHKAPCRAAAFSCDGALVATASEDCSIKILDVEKIISSHHPVIRTLYDHIDEVTCVAFHPREQILVSGKSYENYFGSRADSLSSFASEWRLYNVETSQCFVSAIPKDQHSDTVSDVNYSDNARLYATGSNDGHVKYGMESLTDVLKRFREPTMEHPYVAFVSQNGKYLWELSTNRCLIAYTGAGTTGAQEFPIQAAFNHNEDYVMLPDEKSGSLCSWDSRNSDRNRLLALGHTAPTRAFVHSPTMPAFVTGSDDHRARFWFRKV